LRPDLFEASFESWVSTLYEKTEGRIVSLDGKTVRHSYDKKLGTNAIHMVSAWAGANRLILGQTQVDAKSNEITAIPELLKLIDIEGSIVTIDAMGCQQNIAEIIIKEGADYVLAVKGNQKNLYRDVCALFGSLPLPNHDFTMTEGTGHGRKEARYCSVISDPTLLAQIRGKDNWTGLKSVIRVTSTRKVGKDRRAVHSRFYVSSLDGDAKQALETVRGHWGIENSVHWILDMAFREDESRIRRDHGAENFAILRRIAINLFKKDTETKAGIKGKRLQAGWNNDYLLNLLAA
jgi:predicted transposase YbfD/YdcC